MQNIKDSDKDRVIRAYNATISAQYRYSTQNRYSAEVVLQYADNLSMACTTVKRAIQYYTNKGYPVPELRRLFNSVARDFTRVKSATGEPAKIAINYMEIDTSPGNYVVPDGQQTPQPQPQQPTPQEEVEEGEIIMDKKTTDTVNMLGSVIANVMTSMNMEEIESGVAQNLTSMVDKYIAANYGPIQRTTTVVSVNNQTRKVEGVVHKKFGRVLDYVVGHEPAFLTGPAGTGKNHLVKQICEALGAEFYYSSSVTQEYKILGFTDANGRYQESEFYKACTHDGPAVFMLDEMDASTPEVLVLMNGAIANGYCDFPAPIGKITLNPDLAIVAAGNTTGHGADYDYCGRIQLDAATLDRFGLIRVDYDPAIEEAVAMHDSELLGFCRAYRKACDKAGVKSIVSYRAIGRMAKMKNAMSYKDKTTELLEECLLKGMEKADIQMIKNDCQGYGVYSTALNSLC